MLTTLNGLAAEEEDFKTFLQKFTSSASFQYSRIKFPLKSPIALLKDDGETEQTFPFTREKWALLDEETLKEGRTTEEEGGTYISHFTVNEPAHKEFEAGYDESEPSLRVVFELTDGKWYVTDCYNDWYNFDLPINELEETIQAVQEGKQGFRRTSSLMKLGAEIRLNHYFILLLYDLCPPFSKNEGFLCAVLMHWNMQLQLLLADFQVANIDNLK